MPVEDSPPNNLDSIVERLDHLERILQMQTMRLHAIEQRLGLEPATSTRPSSQSAASPQHEAEKRRDASAIHAPERVESVSATTGDDDPAPFDVPPFGDTTPPPPPVASFEEAIPSSTATPPQVWESLRRQQQGGSDENRARTDESRARADNSRARGGVPPESAPREAAKRRSDLETRIGGSWFNWIGIIAFTFGVAFFLKYAFDNQWIGPTGRVLMGVGVGVVILLVGERLRARGMASYAYVLSGGGILILYLSVYAAFAFYQLIGQIPAFVAMAGVTATAVLLSARYNALPIAILGLIGGFLTPLLLSTGRDNQIALFGYIAVLDAGVLALAYFKQWRSLNYMAFVATVLMQVGWWAVWYWRYAAAQKLWTTIFFLTLFFVMFSLLAILHNVLKQRRAGWPDISLILANATFYFGMCYGLLDDAGYDAVLGSFALMVSAFYILLFYFAHQRHRADRLLRYSYLGGGITFLTMAVSIQLDQQWVTIGWATEALALTWIGLRSDEDAPRLAALGVFAVAIVHWFGWDMLDFAYRADGSFIPLLNRRAVSCAALVGSFAWAAWLYRRAGAAIDEAERSVLVTIFVLAANLLTLTLLSVDVSDYFTQAQARVTTTMMSASVNPSVEVGRLENTKQFTLTTIWVLYGAAVATLGFARRWKALRFGAMALLAVATFKVLSLDIMFYAAAWHVPVFNQTFAAFALVVAALGSLVWWYARDGESIGDEECKTAVPVITVVANLVAIIALSAEASGYFQSKIMANSGLPFGDLRDFRLAQQLALSVIWTIYAGAMLVYGLARRNRLLRVMALALLGVTTLKVFFWDLAALDKIYRIVSFIVLGAILLVVSYIYQQRQQRMANGEQG